MTTHLVQLKNAVAHGSPHVQMTGEQARALVQLAEATEAKDAAGIKAAMAALLAEETRLEEEQAAAN